jgi:hypothetical protein
VIPQKQGPRAKERLLDFATGPSERRLQCAMPGSGREQPMALVVKCVDESGSDARGATDPWTRGHRRP